MSVHTLPLGGALLLVALLAGCSSSPKPVAATQCQLSRSSCMYEGAYEPGEREFAEEEAARLNKAASRKLRRG